MRDVLKIRNFLVMPPFLVACCLAHAAAEPQVVTKRVYHHGDAAISVQQARGKGPALCRASLTVTKNGEETFRIEYDNMDAVGDSFGLFVPDKQPPGDYFFVIKIGDYNGRMFIIDKNGETRNVIGGYYFLIEHDGRPYLFCSYHSDVEGLLVLDLTTGVIDCVTAESPSRFLDIPHVYQWYRLKDRVFYSTYVHVRSNGKSSNREVNEVVCAYNFERKTLHPMEMWKAGIETAEPIEYDFNPHDYPDCECTKEDKNSESN